MAPRTWRDLARRRREAETSPSPPATAQDDERLQALMEERRRLEARLEALTAGQAEDEASRRFPVHDLGTRRAEDRRWERERESRRRRCRQTPRQERHDERADRRRRCARAGGDRRDPMARLDRRVESALAARRQARQVAAPARRGDGRLSIAPPPTSRSGRGLSMRSPSRTGSAWRSRADRLTGQMSAENDYRRRVRRLLAVEVGSLEAFGRSAHRQRQRALARRRERRREERDEQRRRERALEKRRARDEW